MITSKLAIVTDSTSNIPPELVKAYDIHVAPVRIPWGEVTYRDGVDITPKEFYARMRTSTIPPKTDSGIPGEFLKLFEALRGKVDGVVAIVLSPDFPAAGYASALSAKEMVDDFPIEVVDSRLASIAEGWVVLTAARAAAAGANLEEVVRVARETIPKVNVFIVFDTLKYLHRIGRVSAPKALIAEMMKVKPIVTIQDGRVVPAGKARTKPKAIQRLLELMGERVGSTPLHVAIMHADVLEEAEKLKQVIASRFECAELLVTDFTPVMGAATGPGVVGIAFYNE